MRASIIKKPRSPRSALTEPRRLRRSTPGFSVVDQEMDHSGTSEYLCGGEKLFQTCSDNLLPMEFSSVDCRRSDLRTWSYTI